MYKRGKPLTLCGVLYLLAIWAVCSVLGFTVSVLVVLLGLHVLDLIGIWDFIYPYLVEGLVKS